MREANDRGYECLLAEDATESYFPAFKQATLEMIRAQGAIVGWTATVAEILAALETA
jgi:nicotinamidase-related amidase